MMMDQPTECRVGEDLLLLSMVFFFLCARMYRVPVGISPTEVKSREAGRQRYA